MTTEIKIPAGPKGAVVVLGNFDGVHLGHRAVFHAALELASHEGCEVCALTFDPHPQNFFQRAGAAFLLTTHAEKIALIKEIGISNVITLPFTQELAAKEAEAFISDILIKAYQVRHIVVGYDFVFGKGRRGDAALLRKVLEPKGVRVITVPAEKDSAGEIISSSRIRQALFNGQVEKANALLGRKYKIRGKVESGAQRGRVLEYPTANLKWDSLLMRPIHGVYAVWVRREGEDLWWPAVANFGVRPTFETHEELFEFHILHFHGEFYGTDWEVALESFIRAEKKFENADELKQQIAKDVDTARTLLKVNHE